MVENREVEMQKLVYLSFAQGVYENGVKVGKVDGPLLAKSVSGVMIRAGQGIWEDPLFRYHYGICVDNKIPFGIWWFNQPNMTAEPQIEAVMKLWDSLTVKTKRVAFDAEEIDYKDEVDGQYKKLFPSTREFSHNNLLKLCTEVSRLTLAEIGIYTRKYYFQDWTYPVSEWKKFWLWIAAWYNYTGVVLPALPIPFEEYKIHQYEGGGYGTPGVFQKTCKEYLVDSEDPVKFFGNDFASTPVETGPQTVEVISSYLRLGSGPGVQYSALDIWLKKGDRVVILEQLNGWGRCADGWLSLKYTKFVDVAPPVEVLTLQDQIDSLEKRVEVLEGYHGT